MSNQINATNDRQGQRPDHHGEGRTDNRSNSNRNGYRNNRNRRRPRRNNQTNAATNSNQQSVPDLNVDSDFTAKDNRNKNRERRNNRNRQEHFEKNSERYNDRNIERNLERNEQNTERLDQSGSAAKNSANPNHPGQSSRQSGHLPPKSRNNKQRNRFDNERDSRPQNKRRPRFKAEETLQDIQIQIQQINKEIQLEIEALSNIKLD